MVAELGVEEECGEDVEVGIVCAGVDVGGRWKESGGCTLAFPSVEGGRRWW